MTGLGRLRTVQPTRLGRRVKINAQYECFVCGNIETLAEYIFRGNSHVHGSQPAAHVSTGVSSTKIAPAATRSATAKGTRATVPS
jgi:hypothetical protein